MAIDFEDGAVYRGLSVRVRTDPDAPGAWLKLLAWGGD